MRTEQAEALARRVINVWRSTPALGEWIDTLVELDYEHAIHAFADLRSEHEGSMSIARFMAAYRGLTTTILDQRAPGRCELCDGTGYRGDRMRYLVVGTDEEIAAGRGNPYPYPAPCVCTRGDQVARNAPAVHVDRPHRWMDEPPPHWHDIEQAARAAALADPQLEEHADA